MKTIKINFLRLALYTGLILISTSCGSETAADNHSHGSSTMDDHEHTDEDHAHGETDEHGEHGEGIHLTREQLTSMDIEFGSMSPLKINDYVRATGTLGLPPNAYASVSAKHAGFIRNSRNYVEGDLVRKGAVLAQLENPELIEYQQQYLETKAELVFLRQELARQQELITANAGVSRNLEQIQSEVDSKSARLSGIGQRLTYLGISLEDLTAESIRQTITIFAPRTGYITTINMHDGMYVTPQLALMEIVEEDHLHLELDVFEQDIAQISEGQKISYRIPALGAQSYEGEVHVIGREFNTSNKTVRVHGHLEGQRPTFIKDLFVEAKIWLNDQTVEALPEAAVIQSGSNAFIYAAYPEQEGSEVEFEQLRVNPGGTADGFTAIRLIDPVPDGMKVVVQGAYFVHSQGLVGELAHEH